MDRIEQMIAQVVELTKTMPSPHFAVFDFDNTMIKNDCTEATMAYRVRNKHHAAEKHFTSYYSLLDSGDTRGAYRFAAEMLEGLTVNDLDELVQKTMAFEGLEIGNEELVDRIIARGIAPRDHVVGLMRRLQKLRVEVWVISASPELIVRSTMRYFNLMARIIGVRNVLMDSVITPKLVEPLSMFEDKVACIQKYIHPSVRPLFAIGDSMGDDPMLEYSLVKAVVQRNNALSDKARKCGWPIV